MNKLLKVFWWVLGILLLVFIALAIEGFWRLGQKEKTDSTVLKINSTKITLDDVLGKHLPPAPDAFKKDTTVAGIDSNNNGIRDDVELKIFEKYPNSAKMRSAMLQYAQVLQLQLTDVFDSATLVATLKKRNLAYGCLADIDFKKTSEFQNEIEDFVLNTEARIKSRDQAYEYMTSYALPNSEPCDINKDLLPN